MTKKSKKCPMYKEEEPEIMAPWLPDLNLPDPPMQVSSPSPRTGPHPTYRVVTLLMSCTFGLCAATETCIMIYTCMKVAILSCFTSCVQRAMLYIFLPVHEAHSLSPQSFSAQQHAVQTCVCQNDLYRSISNHPVRFAPTNHAIGFAMLLLGRCITIKSDLPAT